MFDRDRIHNGGWCGDFCVFLALMKRLPTSFESRIWECWLCLFRRTRNYIRGAINNDIITNKDTSETARDPEWGGITSPTCTCTCLLNRCTSASISGTSRKKGLQLFDKSPGFYRIRICVCTWYILIRRKREHATSGPEIAHVHVGSLLKLVRIYILSCELYYNRSMIFLKIKIIKNN